MSTCDRVALYVGYDRFLKRRTGQVPLPPGVTPSKTLLKGGVRMELKAITKIDDPQNVKALDALAAVQTRRDP